MSGIYLPRKIQAVVEPWLFKKKTIIIYGARQVGKTTLTKQMLSKYSPSLYLNCERLNVKSLLESKNPERLKSTIGDARLVVLDEAQKVSDIGLILKLFGDTYPETQLIATGSSSFELANKVQEPLTGRNLKFTLYPISLTELSQKYDLITLDSMLEQFLRFGMYPDIVLDSEDMKRKKLETITSDYLYQDVLIFEQLKKSDLLVDLLKALSLQLGSEVVYAELSRLLGTSIETVIRYLDLLEKCFVIFRLRSFSRNLRKELAKSQKVYFFDLGIRNSLISNYNSLDTRNDVGALWENFCIMERLKTQEAQQRFANRYFWRTYDQKEIDYIEEAGGQLRAVEFKWQSTSKVKSPADFLKTYSNSHFQVVHRENYWDWLGS